MTETWYIMEDGSFGDPALIGPGEDGILCDKNGLSVAYGEYGPRSSTVDAAKLRKEMKPEPKRTYKTREVKAD